MAAVNVTLVGLGNGEPFTFVGLASLTGLGVGGGPIDPGKPPGIWGGGNVPMPTPPIANVPGLPPTIDPPGKPDVPPPSIWPPGPGIDFPSHPIIIPDPPIDGSPPIPPGTLIEWHAYWSPTTGWIVLGHPNVPHPAPSGA